MRVEVCLIVAGKLAGLHTDNHHFSWVEGKGNVEDMAALLRAFPVEVSEARLTTGRGFTITGLPANFISRLLSNIPHPTWSKIQVRTDTCCRCK
eukprot:3670130-Heterocapsa_arctica.AAC.1